MWLAMFILGGAVGYFLRGATNAARDGDLFGRDDIEVIVASERRQAYTAGMLDERSRAAKEAL